MIVEEARRLSRLVDNLLDLSRLEAGAAEPRREWMSVEEVLGAALGELRRAGDTDQRTSRSRSTATCRSCEPIRRSWSARS